MPRARLRDPLRTHHLKQPLPTHTRTHARKHTSLTNIRRCVAFLLPGLQKTPGLQGGGGGGASFPGAKGPFLPLPFLRRGFVILTRFDCGKTGDSKWLISQVVSSSRGLRGWCPEDPSILHYTDGQGGYTYVYANDQTVTGREEGGGESPDGRGHHCILRWEAIFSGIGDKRLAEKGPPWGKVYL